MNILSKLFGKKKTKVTYDSVMFDSDDTYNQVASTIDNCVTMDDCKLASTMIDDMKWTYPKLRDNLCNNTFDIFLKQYNKQ
jgi:hypothetical protein